LEQSELDVEVELQELVEEIKEHRNFPKNLWVEVERTDDLDRLLTLRRRILDNSFRLEGDGL
jgi:hypothetical protein